MDLAFSGYNSMVVAIWLDPPCKLTQSLEFEAGESLEVSLHIGHVLEWLLFLDSLPLLLVLPKILEEPSLQLFPLLHPRGGIIVVVEGPKDVIQVLLPSCTPVLSEDLQGVFRGSPSRVSTPLMRLAGLPDGGHILSSPGAAGTLMVIIPTSGSQSSMHLSVPTTSQCRLGGSGVKTDFGYRASHWWLHHLQIWGCWLTPGKWKWLADGWCHPGEW